MGLEPLNDTVFGDVIEHEANEDLTTEYEELTEAFSGSFGVEDRNMAVGMAAKLNEKERKFYQIRVTEIGPGCVDMRVNDVAILPPFGGTMITVINEETNTYRRVFCISEKIILAKFRED